MTTELEWRRQWKPDLKAESFCPFKSEDETFLVKANISNTGYEIFVSNYFNSWYEQIEIDEISKRSKILNPSIEAATGKLMQQIKENVQIEKKGTVYSFKKAEGDLVFSINTKLAGLPFLWTFYCKAATPLMVTENLTLPLVTMVAELKRRQDEMVKILASKDREIEDYKTQGSKVSRKHLETNPFCEETFMSNMTSSNDFMPSDVSHKAFNSEGRELYRQIMTKRAWLHRDPRQSFEGESLEEEPENCGDGETSTWRNQLPASLKPAISPKKSPKKSTPEASPVKDSEALRRQALERRLEEEEQKKEQKAKKKKKMKF